MKNKIILSLTYIIIFGKIYAQNDSLSAYKNLEIKKHYSAGPYSSFYDYNGTYEINGIKVDSTSYINFSESWKSIPNCKPCILQTYGEYDIIITEAVSFLNNKIGYFKEFYPNGQLKTSGYYKENKSGIWDSTYLKDSVNIPVGLWTYYNEKGENNYTEQWDNGSFIKQTPEQLKPEIWKIELTLNGEDSNNKTLLAKEVNKLIVTPKFKYNKTPEVELIINFEAVTIGRKILLASNLEELKVVDIEQKLIENGFKSTDEIKFNFKVYNNFNHNLDLFKLKIIVNLPTPTKEDSLILSKYISQQESEYLIDYSNNSTDRYLVNSLDSTKRIKLKYNSTYYIKYTNPNNDLLEKEKIIILKGNFIDDESINDKTIDTSKISFNFYSETIYTKMDYSTSSIENDFSNSESSHYKRKIILQNINSITFSNSFRNVSLTVGSIFSFVSTLSILIIAPLASIHFKDGNFNKDKYYKIVESGLIGLTAGIPMIALAKEKTYKITTKNGKIGRDFWYIY